MAELYFKLVEYIEKFPSSISYENNHIILKFQAGKSTAEVSRIISEMYMKGTLLKDFSLHTNNISACLDDSAIDRVKCRGILYEIQLNRIVYKYKNDRHAENYTIINLPPEQIEGLSKESSPKIVNALGVEIIFGYIDDIKTSILCPKNLQSILVSLISLYYCCPIEILLESKNGDDKNHTEYILRSQNRTFEDNGSRINLYCKTNSVIEFIQIANTGHPHIQDLPRYVRQFIDSFVVSEPQRFNMLFAMASSFAEYVLGKEKQGGGNLVGKTISHFHIEGLDKIKDIISHAKLTRNGKDISTLADLRNECEHNLYSDASYEFFDNNPSVNVFMYDIACKIVMELAGIKIG